MVLLVPMLALAQLTMPPFTQDSVNAYTVLDCDEHGAVAFAMADNGGAFAFMTSHGLALIPPVAYMSHDRVMIDYDGDGKVDFDGPFAAAPTPCEVYDRALKARTPVQRTTP